MKYKIKHSTTYNYADYVSLCQNQARLTPKTNRGQICHSSRIEIEPTPNYIRSFSDYFNNQVTAFEIAIQHKKLKVTMISEVELLIDANDNLKRVDVPWQDVRNLLAKPNTTELLKTSEFVLPSGLIPIDDGIKDYALISFKPEVTIIAACKDLMARIFHEFHYDPGFTTISTPLSVVFSQKRGVCQDFAHFAIACLRSIGLAGRYVSGYIETMPPEGEVKLEGADATHAWFGVFIPNIGWVDFDPTNNVLPCDQHITLAVGRDFSDVTPLKGVVFGGGSQLLDVAVDMIRLE
ncbi:transglutaminase family protein [Pseudoalteromonas sp. NEC-BIFX-2020_002]|uniref:Transglutaminase n=2 Tax=Pseudoalteromonas TaxID=53246 RepID=A0A0N0M0Q9_9GAMM|nr:transglutaminase family protein [Pseudoalteromonas porphyrae]KPH64341.1 transglutaminase [Pseudoalteromonas porphyrae]NMR24130.1 transglutaminase family protein [Pseudoalteromonas sp. NEC-BIFX-2020_015]NNG43052.1 transglutaminase family protein [Pseudoalteromonas sp. NEC-BIFX-2020_002]